MSHCCTLVYLEVFRLTYTDTLVLQDLVSLEGEALKPTEAELGRQEVCELSPKGQEFGGKQCNSFQCCTETKDQAAIKGQVGA